MKSNQSWVKLKQEFKTIQTNKANDFNKAKYADLTFITQKVKEMIKGTEFNIVESQKLSVAGAVIAQNFIIEVFDAEGEVIDKSNYIVPFLMDEEKKMDPAQIRGKRNTYGRKYVYFMLLGIQPDGEKDLDSEDYGNKKFNGEGDL